MNWDEYRVEMDAVPFDPEFRQRVGRTLAAQDRKEAHTMKLRKSGKRILIAAAVIVVLAAAAAAATLFLRPSQVASEVGDPLLAAAFESGDAVTINQTVQSEGCTVTLLGMVSGQALSSFAQELDESHTYVVAALTNQDGTPYEADTNTVVTPLVAGFAPWQVNIWTLGGGFTAFTRDGVAYYLFDYGDLQAYAGCTVYLAAYQGGGVPSRDDFIMADDGSIAFADSYKGMHALFTLPMQP